jgi:uncharacterized protein (DUF1330 family)
MRRTATFLMTIMAGVAAEAGATAVLHAQSQDKPAYLVAEVEVTNPDAYRAYQKKAIETLKPYNARVIANSKPDVKEGEPSQGNIVILGFKSMADAQKWYSTSPYKELIPERQKAGKTRLYFVEGAPQ